MTPAEWGKPIGDAEKWIPIIDDHIWASKLVDANHSEVGLPVRELRATIWSMIESIWSCQDRDKMVDEVSPAFLLKVRIFHCQIARLLWTASLDSCFGQLMTKTDEVRSWENLTP